MGRAIVTNEDFTAYVSDSALTVGAAVWGGAYGAVLDGVHVVQGEGKVWGVVPHFHNGKCHWVADGEMFPIRMQKLNISFRQTYRWKARFGDIFSFKIKVEVYAKLAKSNDCSTITYVAPLAATSIFRTGLQLTLAMCAGSAHSADKSWFGVINSPSSRDHFLRRYKTAMGDFHSDASFFPNYFGQTCFLCIQSFLDIVCFVLCFRSVVTLQSFSGPCDGLCYLGNVMN